MPGCSVVPAVVWLGGLLLCRLGVGSDGWGYWVVIPHPWPKVGGLEGYKYPCINDLWPHLEHVFSGAMEPRESLQGKGDIWGITVSTYALGAEIPR